MTNAAMQPVTARVFYVDSIVHAGRQAAFLLPLHCTSLLRKRNLCMT